VAEISCVQPQSATCSVEEQPDAVTSADSNRETTVDGSDKMASTQQQCCPSTDDVEDTCCDQPDISMFPFVTVSPCRRKATPPTTRQPADVGSRRPDDGGGSLQSLTAAADNLQSSSSASTVTVTVSSCAGWTSPSPTVSSTWMSPARVSSGMAGPDTLSPGDGSDRVGSPKDNCTTSPQISPASSGLAASPATVAPSMSPGLVRSPPAATSTPVLGARLDVIKVPVYSPVYRDPHAASTRRHRPTSPRRCTAAGQHADVLDLSPSRQHRQQHIRSSGGAARRAITFSADSPRPTTADVLPLRSPAKHTAGESLVAACNAGGSLNRKLSVSTHGGGGDCDRSRLKSSSSVVVCERQEADSASLSPSKLVQPFPVTTTSVDPAATASTSVQSPTTATTTTAESLMSSACSSRLVVNLQRCDTAPPTSVRPVAGASKRRHQTTQELPTAPPAAPGSKRRRLKLMCNGMTIYRDIDDVAASPPSTARKYAPAAATRRRASLPTLPAVSLPSNNVVVKRRHVSTDDVISGEQQQQQRPVPPSGVDVMTSQTDSGLAPSIDSAASDSLPNVPLDYSTDWSSICAVPANAADGISAAVPAQSAVADSSLEEPLELTTAQVRERQKNDCCSQRQQRPMASQFAVC